MNANHLIELLLSDLKAAQPLECFFEVRYRDEICVVHIKLLKQAPQLLIVEFFVDSKCGCDELCIVNHAVAVVVNLTYYLLYLRVIVAQVKLLKRCCKLCCPNHAAVIQVNSLELSTQLLCPLLCEECLSFTANLVVLVVDHCLAHQKIQSSFLKLRDSLELDQVAKDAGFEIYLISILLIRIFSFSLSEERLYKAFWGFDPLCRALVEHLAHEIYRGRRHLFENR